MMHDLYLDPAEHQMINDEYFLSKYRENELVL